MGTQQLRYKERETGDILRQKCEKIARLSVSVVTSEG